MNIWEELLREFENGWTIGPTLSMAPDASGFRGQGARKNFIPGEFDNAEAEWPYENDDEMRYGQPTGPQGLDRGTPMGSDVHGGPPEPKYQDTWEKEGGQEDDQDVEDKFENEGGDVDEAMGTPYNFGQGMKGGGGMGGVTPGTGAGFAHSPATFQYADEDDPPSPPSLSDCFDPSPIDPESLNNPGQDYLNDSTDEDLENRIETMFGAVEDEPESDPLAAFDPHLEMEPGTELNISGEPFETLFQFPHGIPGEFIGSPDQAGAARGLFGMRPGSDAAAGLFPKKSAWDQIEMALDGAVIRMKK